MRILLAVLFGLFVFTIPGQVFPSLKGTTLEGKRADIPVRNGKYSLVAIAFHREAEEDLKKWLQPLYDAFIKKDSGDPFDMAEFHDVNFIFIPLIQGFRKVADEFKANTDRHYWPYILDTEKTDIKTLQEELGVKDQRKPHFYVLDPDGKVVATTDGSFSEKKMEILEESVK